MTNRNHAPNFARQAEIRALLAYRARLQHAGRLIEARAVVNCISILRRVGSSVDVETEAPGAREDSA